MQDFGIILLSNFFTFWFFVIVIQRLSFFVIRIFNDVALVISLAIELIDIELLLVLIIFFFALAVVAQHLLLAVDDCIIFLICCLVWVPTSVFLDVI